MTIKYIFKTSAGLRMFLDKNSQHIGLMWIKIKIKALGDSPRVYGHIQ
jgi:hypothetical protein